MPYALCDVTDSSILEHGLTAKMAANRFEDYVNNHNLAVVGYRDDGVIVHQLNHLFLPTNKPKIKGEGMKVLKGRILKLGKFQCHVKGLAGQSFARDAGTS